jgi:hypothetical protein
MQHGPSRDANSRSASQQNSPPFMEPEGSLPCSQQPAPAHTLPSYLFIIHFNIISLSKPRSTKWSLPFRGFRLKFCSLCVSKLFHGHMPGPSHLALIPLMISVLYIPVGSSHQMCTVHARGEQCPSSVPNYSTDVSGIWYCRSV